MSAVLVSAARSRASKHQSPFILFFTAFAAGLLLSLSFTGSALSWSGLPVHNVAGIQGTAVSDSRRSASGSFLIEMDLERVEDGRKSEADAGGRMLLFFNSDPHVFKGEILSISTNMDVSEEYLQVMTQQQLGMFSQLKNNVVFFGRPENGGITRLGWSSKIFSVRGSLMDEILSRCSGLSGGSGGLFAALFTGCRDGLSAEEVRVFREAGCSHILALSGMHLGIIAGIILLILKPLPGRKAAFFISCAVIFAYLLLTGFGISLVRAAVMYFLGGLAAAFYRKVSGIHVLILSFIVLVLIDPSSFYTISFQLSFLAVGGIIILSPVINRILRPFLPGFLSIALSCSFAAQIFVTPILASAFGELYPVGIAAGIIVAPMVTVFIWIGILYLITGAGFFSAAAGFIYRAVFFVSGRASALPSISTAGSEPAVLILCGTLAAALLSYSIYRSRVDGISGKL